MKGPFLTDGSGFGVGQILDRFRDSGNDNGDAQEGGGDNLDIEWPPWPENPCVGEEIPEYPEREVPEPPRPEDPVATIDAKIWPEEGNSDLRSGCEMAAAHLEYALLKHYGDKYDAHVVVSEMDVSEGVRDRATFKDWVKSQDEERLGTHINTHVGTDGSRGSACCGFGHIRVGDLFDDVTWTDDSCVKRRRYGPAAYGVQQILHESFHQIGISHFKKEITIDGSSHSTIVGSTYTLADENDWHLFELHPGDDPYDGFELYDVSQ